MAGFAKCWKDLKAKGYMHAGDYGEVLTDKDKGSIENRISFHASQGNDHVTSAKLAIQEHLEEADNQIKEIYRQAGVKPAPVSQPAETPTAPPSEPTGTGISNQRLTEAYGDSAPVATTGKGAGAWKDEGVSRLGDFQKNGDVANDPYSVLTNLRKGQTTVSLPSDVSLLRAEHQRLLEDARNAEGTPEYEAKSQAALDMATAIKEVAHGPASDVFRALQEYDKPRYDNVTDFDQALREREGRESTPEEKSSFKKMSEDVASTRNGAEKEINGAQKRLSKFPKMSFDDAAKNIRDQITELTKDCVL